MTGRVRPGRPLTPIAVGVAVLVTWWLVAHNSGSGWVQAIGDAVFGVLLIGLVGPAVVLARVRVQVVHTPGDASAGLPVEMAVEASSRVRLRGIEPTGPEGFAGPVRRRISGGSGMTLIPQHRGVYDRVTVEIATAAPFGLQWWTRRTTLTLSATLYVAPHLGRPLPVNVQDRDPTGDSARRSSDHAGDPRGVRTYRSGDNRRYVHWPATAHTGELMVRELERPAAEPVTITVTLPPDSEEAERISERAFATVLLLLDRGRPVVLGTTEAAGPRSAVVSERRQAGRRLAQAVTAPALWGDGDETFGIEVVK
jgi:uncharacterized protein (DUF58 family)